MRTVSAALAAMSATLLASAPCAAAQPILVEQRMLTQEGLGVALFSTALESQLDILSGSISADKECSSLGGNLGGSAKFISGTVNKNTGTIKSVVDLFFDNACQNRFIRADTTIKIGPDLESYLVTGTADYTGPTGFALGTLTLNEQAYFGLVNGTHALKILTGTGDFAPANHAATVHLGYECETSKKPVPCKSGVAQDFPTLSKALASVTPLKLMINANTNAVTIAASKSNMVTGPLGALSILQVTKTSLAISGQQTPYGSAVTKGAESKFSLFPPMPASWTIKDAANDAIFSIALTNNNPRNFTGTVKRISTGKTLATFSADQSGTGSITYSDASAAAITGWTLSD
jgi:hypothetical protein